MNKFLVIALVALSISARAAESFRILVFSKTLLYRHASITNGVAMLQQLGAKQGFAVDATEDSSAFTPANLARYKIAVFLSTSGDILNPEQQNAFKNFIENGRGFVAIHAAVAGKVATEGDWPWYSQLLCADFHNHKAIERATVIIEDKTHPSTAHLPETWSRVDEWYNFVSTPRPKVHVIASLAEKSFHGGTMGSDHPVVWTRAIGKGRMWYTALGHTEESYSDPNFIQHIAGGIQFAAGLTRSVSVAR
jgi:type 1 glutamine amidotransferase